MGFTSNRRGFLIPACTFFAGNWRHTLITPARSARVQGVHLPLFSRARNQRLASNSPQKRDYYNYLGYLSWPSLPADLPTSL